MKIKLSVIDKYQELCPVSFMKCDSFSEVEYKIRKCITLGKVIKSKDNEKHIQYYYNCFVVKNGVATDLYKNDNTYYEVSERVKGAYDRLEGKLVV